MSQKQQQPNKVVKSKRRPPPPWKPGQSGNPKGRPIGAKQKVSLAKFAHYRDTGMLPMDFLMAVMRDELYTGYDAVGPSANVLGFQRKRNSSRVAVNIDQRIEAAKAAAPYFHRKQPIAIASADGKPIFNLALLQALPTKQLELALGLVKQLRDMINPEGANDGAAGNAEDLLGTAVRVDG